MLRDSKRPIKTLLCETRMLKYCLALQKNPTFWKICLVQNKLKMPKKRLNKIGFQVVITQLYVHPHNFLRFLKQQLKTLNFGLRKILHDSQCLQKN